MLILHVVSTNNVVTRTPHMRDGRYAQLEDDPLFVQLADGPLHAARNLDKIVVPAKIIVGERDKAFFKACQMMNAKLPNSDLTVRI